MDKFQQYLELREKHPNKPKKWFAQQLGVHPSTVTRWDKKLEGRSLIERSLIERIKQELRAELEAEYEAKYQARLEAERKRREAEIEKEITDREAYFRKLLKESGTVIVTSDRDEDIGWQGFHFHIPANTPTEVPGIIAGMLEEIKKARQERDRVIQYYSRGATGALF